MCNVEFEEKDICVDEEFVPAEVEYAEEEVAESGSNNALAIVLCTAAATWVGTKVIDKVVPKVTAWGKNMIQKHKDKKALRKPKEDHPVEPTEEQIQEATSKE